MSILKNYLKKYNVREFSELTEEEKETYRSWEETLQGRKITDNDVYDFLQSELEDTLQKLPKTPTDTRTDLFLKMKLEFIRKIRNFLDSPKVEKKLLEENINKLI